MKTTLSFRSAARSVLMLVMLVCCSIVLTAGNPRAYHVVETTFPAKSALVETQMNNPDYHFSQPGKPGPYVIAQMLMGRQVDELHIYLNGRPGSLLFSSGEVNSSNIILHESHFAEWKNHVKSKVVLHSDHVFSGTEGQNFKTLLEKFTGLEFVLSTE